jgi:hypothetical protein
MKRSGRLSRVEFPIARDGLARRQHLDLDTPSPKLLDPRPRWPRTGLKWGYNSQLDALDRDLGH